jgi:hypothetical protein
MHKYDCKMNAAHFTNMSTGHNRSIMIAKLSSFVPCKVAPPVLPTGGIRKYQTCSTIRSFTIFFKLSFSVWYQLMKSYLREWKLNVISAFRKVDMDRNLIRVYAGHTVTRDLRTINFNIFLSSTHAFLKCSVPFSFSDKTFV